MQRQPLEWNALEHEHIHKNSDWFWALGIIAIAGAAAAIIFSNILFAIVILVGAFTLAINAAKKPSRADFKINERGVIINNTLYPYSSLESFWIEDKEYAPPKLLIKSKKLLSTHIIIPIENVSVADVRDYLLDRINEEEDSEPLSQKIAELFGF